MLPKIDVPVFETTLISTGKKIKFRPFLVKEQKLFMMAMESEDSKDQVEVVKQVLNNCILSKDINVEELPTFDLENLFMQLRAKSVGEVVNLRYNCNNLVKKENGEEKPCNNVVKIDVNLNEVKPILDKTHDKKIAITDSMGMVMRYPTIKMIEGHGDKIETENVELLIELIANCIDYIYDKDQIYYAKDCERQELIDFVENLQQSDLEKVQKFFTTMPKIKKQLKFKCVKCGYDEDITIEGVQNFFV